MTVEIGNLSYTRIRNFESLKKVHHQMVLSMEVAQIAVWPSAAFRKCGCESTRVKPWSWVHQTEISCFWVWHLYFRLDGRLSAHLALLNDASRTLCSLHPPWRLLCPILRPRVTHQTVLFSWCRLSPLVSGSFVSLSPPEGIVSVSDQRTSSFSIRTVCKLWRSLVL